MPRPTRIMLTSPDMSQAPFAEYDAINHRWRVWQAFSPDVASGTYLDLYPSGLVERTTTLNGEIQDIVRIANPLQEM